MLQYGIVNAVNLDGGGSATYTVNGTLVNYPSDQWYVTFTIHIYFKGRGQSKLQNLCPIPIIHMILYISTMKICLFMEILWRINVYSCLNQYESKASNVLTTLSTSGKFNTFQITVNILYFACTMFGGKWFLNKLAWIWITIFVKVPILLHICKAFRDVINLAEWLCLRPFKVNI